MRTYAIKRPIVGSIAVLLARVLLAACGTQPASAPASSAPAQSAASQAEASSVISDDDSDTHVITDMLAAR